MGAGEPLGHFGLREISLSSASLLPAQRRSLSCVRRYEHGVFQSYRQMAPADPQKHRQQGHRDADRKQERQNKKGGALQYGSEIRTRK